MFFVVTHYIDLLSLATIPTNETCPYCNNQEVLLCIRQKRIRTFGLSRARRRDKVGLAVCKHCGNEINEKRWTPTLHQLFSEQKNLYNLTFWQRYGFWIGWFSIWPALILATWLYIALRGW